MDGFNLQSAKPVAAREDDGIVLELRDERGEPMTYGPDAKPVTVKVAGTYSNHYRRAQERQRDRMMKSARGRLNGDVLQQNLLDLTASCVLAWEGIFDGETPVPCTKDNAVLLLEVAPWLREQIEEAMSDHQGFSKTSSPS